VTAAGVITPEQLSSGGLKLKNVIWVVEESSRHMDFKQDPNASEWHAIVEAAGSGTADLPWTFEEGQGPNVLVVSNAGDVVEFDQKVGTPSPLTEH
jgi:hypothetical protein